MENLTEKIKVFNAGRTVQKAQETILKNLSKLGELDISLSVLEVNLKFVKEDYEKFRKVKEKYPELIGDFNNTEGLIREGIKAYIENLKSYQDFYPTFQEKLKEVFKKHPEYKTFFFENQDL